MKHTQLISSIANVTGASFIGLDTLTEPLLRKTHPTDRKLPNPHYGRVTKRMTGANVMVFTNKNGSAYGNMVERRLIQEGKDPTSFVLGERAWGTRIPNMPIVEHNKNGNVVYYLEVIFLKEGKIEWLLDNKPIDKSEIIGLPVTEVNDDAQGGLDNLVVIRCFMADSITELRIDGLVWN